MDLLGLEVQNPHPDLLKVLEPADIALLEAEAEEQLMDAACTPCQEVGIYYVYVTPADTVVAPRPMEMGELYPTAIMDVP